MKLKQKKFVRTSDIEAAAKAIAEADELDIDTEKLGSRQIGRILSKLRFEKGSEGGTHRKGWRVSRRELSRFARSLGLVTNYLENVTSVTEGHNVTPDVSETFDEDVAFEECADYFGRVSMEKTPTISQSNADEFAEYTTTAKKSDG